jgi:4-carboxymuconolactone decarboxylase
MNLKTRLRRTDPRDAVPQPPMALPEGQWIGLDYPRRIPALGRRELRRWQRMFLTGIRLGAGDTYDYTCFLVTARLGRVFPLHTVFFSQLLQHGRIPQADSEQIVIRVAWRMGCQYEYAHHTRMALELGVPRSEIETLTHHDDDTWSARTRALMTAADELLATKNLSPLTYERLRRELDENQILEFSMLVGHYVMAGMMLGVAGVQIEPAFELDGTFAGRTPI